MKKNIIIIADTFFPDNSSVSVQIADLAEQLIKEDCICYIILPSSLLIEKNHVKVFKKNINLIFLKSFKQKHKSFVLRAFSELFLPFCLIKNFNKNLLNCKNIYGIVCYSPSIFFGVFVKMLKQTYSTKSYLIVRDLFPRWTVDLGLLSKSSLQYKFFDFVNNYQYKQNDFIGIQSIGNFHFFKKDFKNKIEVLPNWLNPNINPVEKPKLGLNNIDSNKFIITYTGNIGVAQGFDVLFDTIKILNLRDDILFIIIGKGDKFSYFKDLCEKYKLNNIYLLSDLHPKELDAIYNISNLGLVSLDIRHKTHNIPGKLINYLKYGLPVFVNCNPGNDLINMINENFIGFALSSNNPNEIKKKLLVFIKQVYNDKNINKRCRKYFMKNFDVNIISKKILRKLGS